jgi:hypothetical protein
VSPLIHGKQGFSDYFRHPKKIDFLAGVEVASEFLLGLKTPPSG